MNEEPSKRRRGKHRRRRQDVVPPSATPETGSLEDPAEAEDPDAEEPPSQGRRFGSLFRRGSRDQEQEDEYEEDELPPERGPVAEQRGGSPQAAPMDFWRRGKARPYREAADREREMGLWQRITGFYFPPWVPVVGIIVIVFGILGLLFVARSATGAPRSGDHWHATYQIFICGQKQPDIPSFEAAAGSPGTHGDGIMHQHPFAPQGEGAGSNLGNFFGEGGGKIDGDELRIPGTRTTYKNGDECPDGTIGTMQVSANLQPLQNYSRYIAKDGDQVRISFGPPEEVISLDDRTVIADGQATREVTLDVSGNESATRFTPASIDLSVGEAVRVRVRNLATVSHSFRASGTDGEYGTGDDFVVTPDGEDPELSSGVLLPGGEGSVVIRFDTAGTVEFRDDTAQSATGEIVVGEAASEGEEEDDADIGSDLDPTVEVSLTDHAFTPSTIEVDAGEEFRIGLTNDGQFIHNLRIAGPDGEYRTDDDIVSDIDPVAGESADVIGILSEPGEYAFRCDFHPTEQVGVIIAK